MKRQKLERFQELKERIETVRRSELAQAQRSRNEAEIRAQQAEDATHRATLHLLTTDPIEAQELTHRAILLEVEKKARAIAIRALDVRVAEEQVATDALIGARKEKMVIEHLHAEAMREEAFKQARIEQFEFDETAARMQREASRREGEAHEDE